jgi:hypothetical protein
VKDAQVRGFESDGVNVISPLAPDFDSRADALAPPGFADVVREAKPYVVIVANNSSRRIVGLTLSSSNAEGRATPQALGWTFPEPAEQNQLFIAPDAAGATGVDFGDRSERGIPSGGQRLMGIGFEIPERKIQFGPQPEPGWDDERIWNWCISATRDFISRIKSQDPDTEGIRVRLDAVIFEDGSLIGPDAGDFLRASLERHIKAKQDLYRRIVERMDAGVSIDEAGPAEPAMELRDVGEGLSTVHDMHAHSEAVNTVRALRKAYGDTKIRDVLEQAILKEPFVVHRK